MIASHRIQPISRASLRLVATIAGVMLAALSIAAQADPREVLGPGDTVRVTVFQHPDLSSELRLSARGTVVFPMIGEVPLAGKTPTDAGEELAERLAKGRYLVDPQVSVSLVEVRSRQVSVLGHVTRPGQYPLDSPGLTLTDLLALAGGISPSGDGTVIAMVRRDGETRRLEIDVPAMYRSGDLSENIELQGGDTIFVPSAPVFYVYGQVQRAGAYRLEPEMSVLSALSLGGGLTPRGTHRGLTIHRRTPDGKVERVTADLSDPVLPNDVIYVEEGLF